MNKLNNDLFSAGDMYDKRLRKEFKKIDKDGGGFVDISELSAYILKKYKHRFRLGKFKVPASEKF